MDNKEDLTDVIDSELDNSDEVAGDTATELTAASEKMLSDIGSVKPTDDLAELLGYNEEVETPQQTQGMKVIADFEKLKNQYDTDLFDKMKMLNFDSLDGDENILRDVSRRLYDEIHKYSKKYLAMWCKVNGYNQKWTNPFASEFKMRNLNQFSKFIPKVYSIRVTNGKMDEDQVLCEYQPTPREATIQASKKVGFDNSIERKLAFGRFTKASIDALIKDSKYIREAKLIYTLEEHRRQVDSQIYVPKSIRDKWQKDLEEQISKVSTQF